MKLVVMLGLTLLLVLLWSAPVALAKVQFLKEADQWVYQSQQTLTDTMGNSWEITALKPMEQPRAGVYLWLTTQTDSIHLDATQPLIVKTNSGEELSASNLTRQHFIGDLPASNIAQYDIRPLLPYLQDTHSLKLQLSTKTRDDVNILIPHDVLEEWLNVGTCQSLICADS
ncbi:orf8 unidentified orf in hydrogenase protein cluster [Leptolyngbya sp. Heron Island J]|nr:orf8 unidentified orf in hydrogenase protein cluster [Leptolyngbya sp. Heron Island J]